MSKAVKRQRKVDEIFGRKDDDSSKKKRSENEPSSSKFPRRMFVFDFSMECFSWSKVRFRKFRMTIWICSSNSIWTWVLDLAQVLRNEKKIFDETKICFLSKTGITRRVRYERAIRHELEPPIRVLELIETYPNEPKVIYRYKFAKTIIWKRSRSRIRFRCLFSVFGTVTLCREKCDVFK